MANAPITTPRLFSHIRAQASFTRPRVIDAQVSAQGVTSFYPGQFVVNVSNILNPFIDGGTGTGSTTGYAYYGSATGTGSLVLLGLATDASHLTTDETYTNIFGNYHNVIDPSGATFLMNITDGAGTVGSAGSGTAQSNVTVGTAYGGRYMNTGNLAVLGINSQNTTAADGAIFKVVALYNSNIAVDGDASADFNGRVLVQVLGTGIQ